MPHVHDVHIVFNVKYIFTEERERKKKDPGSKLGVAEGGVSLRLRPGSTSPPRPPSAFKVSL